MKVINWVGLHPLQGLLRLAFLGGIVGASFIFLVPYLLWLSWERVVTPPPAATRIVALRSPLLYLRAADNALYTCDMRQHTCTQTPEPFKLTITRENLNCPAIEFVTPILVSNIVDVYAQRECFPDTYHYTDWHVIVLDDGSVWIERDIFMFNDNGWQSLLLTGGCGATLGFIVGMVTLVGVWTAEDKQRRQRKLNPIGKSP